MVVSATAGEGWLDPLPGPTCNETLWGGSASKIGTFWYAWYFEFCCSLPLEGSEGNDWVWSWKGELLPSLVACSSVGLVFRWFTVVTLEGWETNELSSARLLSPVPELTGTLYEVCIVKLCIKEEYRLQHLLIISSIHLCIMTAALKQGSCSQAGDRKVKARSVN